MLPSNSLQRRLLQMTLESHRQTAAAQKEERCVILKVFDADQIAEEPPTADIALKIKKFPGVLFALVRLLSIGRELYLPFKDDEGYIFSTYGNGTQLEGRIAKIVYRFGDYDTGRIVFSNESSKRLGLVAGATIAYDIGGIL